MHTVEFEGVSKFFAEKEVIRDISLSVEKGEILDCWTKRSWKDHAYQAAS